MLPESAVIAEYLEERYPEPPLLPADPADRALVRLLAHRHDEVTGPYYALRRGDEDAAPRLDAALASLDAVLRERPFLGADAFGLADVSYLPWLLRAEAFLGVSFAGTPALSAWLERCLARPSVAAEAAIVARL